MKNKTIDIWKGLSVKHGIIAAILSTALLIPAFAPVFEDFSYIVSYPLFVFFTTILTYAMLYRYAMFKNRRILK